MSEPRRPFRRGRRSRPSGNQPLSPESYGDADPYLEPMDPSTPPPDAAQIPDARDNMNSPVLPSPAPSSSPAASPPSPSTSPAPNAPESSAAPSSEANSGNPPAAPAANGSGNPGAPQQQYNPQTMGGGQQREGNPQRHHGERDHRHNGRRGRNQRGRGRQRQQQQPHAPRREQRSPAPMDRVVREGDTTGWVDPQREGGF